MSITWRKLERPRTWRPCEAGAELVGYYLGQTIREGEWGQYKVVLVACPDQEGFSKPYMVSGVQLIQALDGSSVQVGAFIRIVYTGPVPLSGDRTMKGFEVYLGEGVITPEKAREYMMQLEGS